MTTGRINQVATLSYPLTAAGALPPGGGGSHGRSRGPCGLDRCRTLAAADAAGSGGAGARRSTGTPRPQPPNSHQIGPTGEPHRPPSPRAGVGHASADQRRGARTQLLGQSGTIVTGPPPPITPATMRWRTAPAGRLPPIDTAWGVCQRQVAHRPLECPRPLAGATVHAASGSFWRRRLAESRGARSVRRAATAGRGTRRGPSERAAPATQTAMATR